MVEPFRVGGVVARSFSIWGRELPLLLAIALVVHAPRVVAVELVGLAMPQAPRFDPDSRRHGEFMDELDRWLRRAVPVRLASHVVATVLGDITLAFVAFAVYARLRGRRASVGESVRNGLRRIAPVLRASLCLCVVSSGIGLGGGLLAWKLLRAGHLAPAAGLLTLPGALLLALLLSPFWVAVPAAVADEPKRLLRRSFRLTRGHRLAVCAGVLLLCAIDWGSGRLLRAGLSSVELPPLARSAVWWTQELLVVSLAAVLAAVGYHALRLEKEGVDVSDLERVFA